ncbi:MAG: acyl carrier protein [Butyrivibrio sp.]|nr:acyl carrier protein [Butyrivibrio sp.]
MKIRDGVIKCLQKIKGEYFDQEDELISGGWIDSFELIKLIKELDAEFEIKIKPADVIPDQFDSVQQICELIELYFGK